MNRINPCPEMPPRNQPQSKWVKGSLREMSSEMPNSSATRNAMARISPMLRALG